jgi:site-specific DNA-adenine methylase
LAGLRNPNGDTVITDKSYRHFWQQNQGNPKKGDFVYFDPPYYKLGGYSDFNRYTPSQFREPDHERLALLCCALDERGEKLT